MIRRCEGNLLVQYWRTMHSNEQNRYSNKYINLLLKPSVMVLEILFCFSPQQALLQRNAILQICFTVFIITVTVNL